MSYPGPLLYPCFFAANGDALDSGYIYIGLAHQNPITNPAAIYWNSDLTVPAAQPLRTNGGFIVRNGSPAFVYTADDYSITVQDKRTRNVYTNLNVPNLSASGGAALVGFIDSGSGAVAETVQGWIRRFMGVSLTSFMSDADRLSLLNGARVDVTTALTRAAATHRPILWPKGKYEITSEIGIESDVIGAGAHSNASGYGTDILLSGAGMLTLQQPFISVTGVYIASAVNSLTFTKITAQGVRFNNFQLIGTGTSQVGIELDTTQGAIPGAVSFLDIDHFKISGIHTPMKTTGAEYFNGNKLGSASCNWSGFTNAIVVANTGGFGVNTIDGYFESSVNPHSIINVQLGSTFANSNIIDGWFDAGASVVLPINNSGTVGTNIWTRMTPDMWNETGSPVTTPQIFTHKCKARATMSGDQTGIANATSTKVAFDTETYDDGGIFDTTDDRFECFRAAYVEISAKVKIGGNISAGSFLLISIFKNGASVSAVEQYAEGVADETIEITDTFLAAVSDYFEVYIRADGGGTHTVTASGSSVSCVEL